MSRQVARRVAARAGALTRRMALALGFEPHRASERRAYWEERGAHYKDQVRSILDPADPYWRAQQEFVGTLGAFEWHSILEVGCGFGWHLKAVRQAFPGRRVDGLDFSVSQLQQAREYLGSTRGLLQADASRLPAADRAYDVVFTSGLLVCIHPDHVGAVMREIVRVARDSVMTLEYAREHVATPAARATMAEAAWHGHEFTRLYVDAGLQIARAEPFAAFAAEPDRVPLSFFHGRKVCGSTS